jgi:hypothetical protein
MDSLKPNMRDNTMRMILIVSLTVVLLAIASPPVAAELAVLSGTVYNGGVPAANLSITVEGRNAETRTDGKGGYRFDLPAGGHVLLIRGQRFPVTVSPGGTRRDIRF